MAIGVADLAGRVMAGRYRLRSSIGAGGGGRVYVADDVRLGRTVAVKVLHPALADDAGFLRRFRAEAQLAASLHHPHVMAVYDWGEDGLPFMVLELLAGGSLRTMLDRDVRLAPSQAAHVGRQVASALEYAHTRGLVHRDIKPANLLFDEHGIARVADFGLARALAEASWTEPTGALVGTARYAAPEQATGVALDGRADLYALALVLVEAVTGKVPFAADTPIGTLALRQQQPLVAPDEVGPVGRVLERAGRPDPEQRYPDARAMKEALIASARRLPAPRPLKLAGLSLDVEDPNPTQHRRSGPKPFDQDAEPASPAVALLAPTRDSPPEATSTRESGALFGPRRQLPAGARRAVPAVVATLVVLALLAAALLVARAGPSGATVTTPALVGLNEQEAATIAADAAVLMRVEERTSDDPAGVVLDQRPSPGSWVAEGDAVHVVVSSGPPPVAMPDVSGRPEAEATLLLVGAGFAVEPVMQHHESVSAGSVIGTEPAGGTQVPPDSRVRLIVSDGPAPVAVPGALEGNTYEEAAAALEAARLVPVRRDDFSDSVEAGMVIRTDPSEGELAPRDSEVTVIVSKGPELVQVPDLRLQTVEQATAALESLGLEADVESFSPGGPVRAHDPPAGATIPKGSKVTLFL